MLVPVSSLIPISKNNNSDDVGFLIPIPAKDDNSDDVGCFLIPIPAKDDNSDNVGCDPLVAKWNMFVAKNPYVTKWTSVASIPATSSNGGSKDSTLSLSTSMCDKAFHDILDKQKIVAFGALEDIDPLIEECKWKTGFFLNQFLGYPL